jgi:hypothetical protein
VLAIAALLISAAALAVACASVYLSTLAPAEIALDAIPMHATQELPTGGYSPFPEAHEVWLAFFLSDTGARGGLLESIEVEAADTQPEDARYWTNVHHVDGPLPRRDPSAASLGAIALEAGDVKTVWLLIHLQFAGPNPEEQARRMRNLETLRVTVIWNVVRTHPLRRGSRQTVKGSLDLTIDARYYRDHAIRHWRSVAQYAHLAEIAVGSAEPTST